MTKTELQLKGQVARAKKVKAEDEKKIEELLNRIEELLEAKDNLRRVERELRDRLDEKALQLEMLREANNRLDQVLELALR